MLFRASAGTLWHLIKPHTAQIGVRDPASPRTYRHATTENRDVRAPDGLPQPAVLVHFEARVRVMLVLSQSRVYILRVGDS